jgi:hypothetical protein
MSMGSLLPGRIPPARRAATASLAALLLLLLLQTAACGTASPPLPPGPPTPAQETWTAGGDQDGISPILATTLLRTGPQRVSFLLVSPTALVRAPEVTVTTTYLDGDGATGETRPAVFHLWPYGLRGSYSTRLNFDRPGNWRLDISVDEGEFTGQTYLTVQVAAESLVPDVGEVPPRSQTKTLEGEGRLDTLTSAFMPDPDLYLVTIDQAIQDTKPGVIVFDTPSFCTSPTCGPQTETLAQLKEEYRGDANFIHVEIYDNPHEIQGDLDRARISPAVQEWGFDRIPGWFNESWTYVLDPQGRVHQRFEGYVTLEELEAALLEVLPPAGATSGPPQRSG